MMAQGVWVLMIMIYGARLEITLVPYMDSQGDYLEFPNREMCEAWKGRESLEHIQPLTCLQKEKEI